ncbi:MAG: DNA/RNA nuclease SfsA [Hyphomicrobiales bacterium]|nr:DNA/RNA nuclease SfsA [Hyphomicrobiales bacterium]
MLLPSPLIQGRLVRRYKRFLADVELDGRDMVTVHCANPGAMTGLAEPGMRVFLSRSDNPKRKLPLSWELVEADGGLVGINTAHPNRLAEEAIIAGTIPELDGYPGLKREVRYGANSRIDILLSGPGRPDAYVEVKNVHLLRQPGLAEFPDSVTARGAKHLDELIGVVSTGGRAVMLYLVQRTDASRFALARDIDPRYAAGFDRAGAAGVEMFAYRCAITPREIAVSERLSITD